MLPTGFRNSDIQLGLEGGYIYYKTNCIDERTRYQHLYITDDSEIKEGDYAYCTRVEQIYRVGKFDSKAGHDGHSIKLLKSEVEEGKTYTYTGKHYSQYSKKVIGTTDPELKDVPQIPQSFIEEYCRKGGIDEVDVEYEKYHDGNFINDGKTHAFTALLRPEVSNDNIINIQPIKDSWTVENLPDLLNRFCKDHSLHRGLQITDDMIKEWLEKQ